MITNWKVASVWIVGWLCSAAIVLGIVLGLFNGVTASGERETRNIEVCVGAGGQWISDNCVSGKEVQQ